MTLARSTVLVSGLTFGGYLVGIAVQVLFALSFGAGPSTDAWFAAVAVPNFLAAVLFASLAKAALPIFVERHEEDPRGARRTVVATAGVTGVGLVVLAMVVRLSPERAADLLFPSFDASRRELSATLLGVAIWAVPAVGVSVVLAAGLQARRRFGLPALATTLQPAGVLVSLLLFREESGVSAMATGLVVGSLLQAVVLLIPYLGERSVPLGDAFVRRILARAGPLIVAAALVAVYPLLEKWFGSRLPASELSYLAYGRRPMMLLVFLVAAPVSITSFTAFAESAARGDLTALHDRAWRTAAALFLFVAPAVAFFLVFGEDVLRVLYERGRFTARDTRAATDVLVLLLPLAVFASAGQVLVHVFLARGRTRVPLLAAIAGVVVYVCLAPAAVGAYGPRGLAALQTIAVGLSVGLAIAVLLAGEGRAAAARSFLPSFQITIAATLTGALLWFTRDLVPDRDRSLVATIAGLAMTAAGAGAVYLGLLALVRNATLADVIRSFTRRTPTSSPTADEG